jgi:protein gp37
MNPAWVRSLRDQCQQTGVPFFFKQWGEWAPFHEHPEHLWSGCRTCTFDSKPSLTVARIGKKAAGHLLDGREWRELPV